MRKNISIALLAAGLALGLSGDNHVTAPSADPGFSYIYFPENLAEVVETVGFPASLHDVKQGNLKYSVIGFAKPGIFLECYQDGEKVLVLQQNISGHNGLVEKLQGAGMLGPVTRLSNRIQSDSHVIPTYAHY